MHAVILSRVSSEEQKQGFSPEAQLTNARRYLKALKFDLLKEFYFDESASYSKPNSKRTKFWEVIDYVKEQHKINKKRVTLICEVVDRLQRGFRELNTLEDLINDGVIELHFVEDHLVVNRENIEDTGGNWESKILESKNYIRKLRKNVKRGMRGAREEGVVFKFPEGYTRKNGEVSTTDSSELISEAFLLFSTGSYSQTEIVFKLNEKGFKTQSGKKLTPATLNKILNNTFYYGLAKSTLGNYRHIYKPLTTEAIFDKCQAILKGRVTNNKKAKWKAKPFAFREVLTCVGCKRTINPDGPKKGIYNYYRCANKECVHYQKVVKEEVVLNQAEEILKHLVFPDEAIEFIVEKLRSDFDKESLYIKQKRAEIYSKIEEYENMRSTLVDKYLLGSITDDIYSKKSNEYESKVYELNLQLTQETRGSSELHLTVQSVFNLVNRLPEIFKSSNTTEKNQILKYILSNSLQEGAKVDLNLKKPFLYLFKKQDIQCWFGDRDSNSG